VEKVQNVKNVHFQKFIHILKCSDYRNVQILKNIHILKIVQMSDFFKKNQICLNLYFKKWCSQKSLKHGKITRYNEKVKKKASRTLISENERKRNTKWAGPHISKVVTLCGVTQNRRVKRRTGPPLPHPGS
jgi:hypothetical protein